MVQVFDYIQRKKDKKKEKIGIRRKLIITRTRTYESLLIHFRREKNYIFRELTRNFSYIYNQKGDVSHVSVEFFVKKS